MFNKIILVGNLTKDMELKNTQGNTLIASTSIATNRKFKNTNGEQKEEVLYVDITFFGRTAEVASQYLRRGSKVLVEGKLKFDQWVDQSGQKRSKHSVEVSSMQMLDSKSNASNTVSPSITNQPSSLNQDKIPPYIDDEKPFDVPKKVETKDPNYLYDDDGEILF